MDDPTAANDDQVAPAHPNNMIKLTYCDKPSRGEPVRLALVLDKVPFEDVRVQRDERAALQPQTSVSQLPVRQVGKDGPIQTQSMAMLRWIGAKYTTSLYPPDKLYEIKEALGVLEDLDWIVDKGVSIPPEFDGLAYRKRTRWFELSTKYSSYSNSVYVRTGRESNRQQ